MYSDISFLYFAIHKTIFLFIFEAIELLTDKATESVNAE